MAIGIVGGNMEPLVDAVELARRWNTSRERVWQLGRDGIIPVIRIGHRTLRYDPEACMEALQERQEPRCDQG